jgi:hypothetical protein
MLSLVDEAREGDAARRTLEEEKDAARRTLEYDRDAQLRTLQEFHLGDASVQEEIRRASSAADAAFAVIGRLGGAVASLERWREEAASISGQLAATEQDVAELEVRNFQLSSTCACVRLLLQESRMWRSSRWENQRSSINAASCIRLWC